MLHLLAHCTFFAAFSAAIPAQTHRFSLPATRVRSARVLPRIGNRASPREGVYPLQKCHASELRSEDAEIDAVQKSKAELEALAGEVLMSRRFGDRPPSSEMASQFREKASHLVEAADRQVDLEKLPGLWRLEYTTAPDVLSIFELERLPLSPVRVGKIYQRYGPSVVNGGSREGQVENIVELALPPLTEEDNGLTFTVTARYYQGEDDVAIAFERAGVDKLRLSALFEGLLAPAVVPRMDALRNLARAREFGISVPLVAPSSILTSITPRTAGRLRIKYVDEDLLLGEAFSGLFFFRREAD